MPRSASQGVFSVDKEKGLTLQEIAEGVTLQQVVEATEAEFQVAQPLKPMKQVLQSGIPYCLLS